MIQRNEKNSFGDTRIKVRKLHGASVQTEYTQLITRCEVNYETFACERICAKIVHISRPIKQRDSRRTNTFSRKQQNYFVISNH